jgi:uncharacterized protein
MDRHERSEGAQRQRRCVATGEVRPDDSLIRFVADPDGVLFADVAARAPGRGVWVSATRQAVLLAARKGGFARGLKQAVKVPDGIDAVVEAALERRVLDFLGLARRAGQVVAGFDQVDAALRRAAPAWRIEASDGATDGRRKLDGLSRGWGDIPVAGCLSGAHMGMALGRDLVIHACLPPGRLAEAFGVEVRRLAGFRPLVPPEWGQVGP